MLTGGVAVGQDVAELVGRARVGIGFECGWLGWGLSCRSELESRDAILTELVEGRWSSVREAIGQWRCSPVVLTEVVRPWFCEGFLELVVVERSFSGMLLGGGDFGCRWKFESVAVATANGRRWPFSTEQSRWLDFA